MFHPLPLYFAIILQVSTTELTGIFLNCSDTENAIAGKNITIKCNISKEPSCVVTNCACTSNQQECNCNWTETGLSLYLLNVNEDQDLNVSMFSNCGIPADRVELKVNKGPRADEVKNPASPPERSQERSHEATVAVGVIFGIVAVLILLSVLLHLVCNKYRQASSKRSPVGLT